MRFPESIVYMTFVTHLDCNVFIFPRSRYSTHTSTLVIKKIISPRFWETRDQRSPGSFADVDSDESDLSLDRDEGTEGESDSEVIMPGHEISQTEPALVESDDVVVPFDRVVKNPGFLKKKTAHAGCFIN